MQENNEIKKVEYTEDELKYRSLLIKRMYEAREQRDTPHPEFAVMTDPYGVTFYGIRRYCKTEGHLDWVGKDTIS